MNAERGTEGVRQKKWEENRGGEVREAFANFPVHLILFSQKSYKSQNMCLIRSCFCFLLSVPNLAGDGRLILKEIC